MGPLDAGGEEENESKREISTWQEGAAREGAGETARQKKHYQILI